MQQEIIMYYSKFFAYVICFNSEQNKWFIVHVKLRWF